MKLCREQGYSIQAALWATYRNQEHRMKHWVTLLSIANSRSEHFGQSCQRDRATEEAGGSVAKGPIPVSTRGQRLWKKFSKLSRSARFSGSIGSTGFFFFIFQQRESRSRPRREKKRAAAAKVRFSIRARLPSFSKRLGTRHFTSTTERDRAFASRSKANLVQDRIAGSIIIAPVVTKLVFLVTIVCAWLTSEWMPRQMAVGTRRLPTS